jgi:hypothetical protein
MRTSARWASFSREQFCTTSTSLWSQPLPDRPGWCHFPLFEPLTCPPTRFVSQRYATDSKQPRPPTEPGEAHELGWTSTSLAGVNEPASADPLRFTNPCLQPRYYWILERGSVWPDFSYAPDGGKSSSQAETTGSATQRKPALHPGGCWFSIIATVSSGSASDVARSTTSCESRPELAAIQLVALRRDARRALTQLVQLHIMVL